MINHLKNLIPLVTFFLIIGSGIELITYYSQFGIDITNYMDFTEFAFAFLDNIYSYFYVFGNLLIWILIDDMFINKDSEDKNLVMDKRNYFRNLIGYYFLLYIIFTISRTWFLESILIPIIFASIFTIYVIFLIKYSKIDRYSKYYALIPTIFFMSYLNAHFDAVSVLDSNLVKKQISFELNKNEIKTDSINLYLGRTKNYIFLYDKEKAQSKIYQSKNIDEIVMSKK